MIDEDITYADKGYRSYELKPKSHERVWAVCDSCGIGRWIEFCQYHDLCNACAKKKNRKHDYDDNVVRSIDEDKTFLEKGHRSNDLSAQSSKEVYAICVECGEGRWVRFCNYRDLCLMCARKKTRKHNYECFGDIVRSIDEEKTFAEKGYYSTDLPIKSAKKVYAICTECGYGRWVIYGQYHDLCNSCVRKGNRNHSWKGGKKTKVCEWCGEEYKERTLNGYQRYCSMECMGKARAGENNTAWKGGISVGEYCKFFDEPLKVAVRNYFDNLCFECDRTIEENKGRNMSVHHVNYQKDCGCNNTHFCVYVPLCNSCHGKSSNGNRWYWYLHFMTELALRNPNYYAYHIPVVYYDEPSYNYGYVFEKNRTRRA